MKKSLLHSSLGLLLCAAAFAPVCVHAQTASIESEIRTPKAPATPRINGPGIFGVRPQHPFLYHIPATGDRPMTFSADNLPPGLTIDPKTGNITGIAPSVMSAIKSAPYTVTLHAKN
ncbi:MAG TPA: Ig domain-containing protein, partial [Candidatus Polarisedimenticolia bacterium]|nr:Ig domain-containing protein [Candidatus Polarisedimenticolia bacterium]